MMIKNALLDGKHTVIKKPHLTAQATENKKAEINKAVKAKGEKAAAVFEQSRKEDYDEKKLSPLQKNIMDLRERIFKLKEDESIKKETKDKLLQDMNKQLLLMEKQLEEETEQEMKAAKEEKENGDSADGVLSKDNKDGGPMTAGKARETDSSRAIMAAGAGLERMDSMGELAEKNKGRAKAAQRELDYAVNHPCLGNPEQSSLRLHDKNIIRKKQNEINDMNGAAETLQEEMSKIGSEQKEKLEETNRNDEMSVMERGAGAAEKQ